MIPIGNAFPSFRLVDEKNTPRTLSDWKGKWLVLYFYPKDFTPGCSIEAHEFAKARKDFAKIGAEVIGISKDSPKSHARFCEEMKLGFTLLSDPTKELYAAAQIPQKKFMGHLMYGRATYILDPEGKVRHTFPAVTPLGHAKECLTIIHALQAGSNIA